MSDLRPYLSFDDIPDCKPKTMSKNLSKASDWAQREIDDLQWEKNDLMSQHGKIEERIEAINAKIDMLTDIKTRLSNGEEKQVV